MATSVLPVKKLKMGGQSFFPVTVSEVVKVANNVYIDGKTNPYYKKTLDEVFQEMDKSRDAIDAKIGDLDQLNTSIKEDTIVASINSLKNTVATNDDFTAINKTLNTLTSNGTINSISTAITDAINALDVSSVGGTSKYISTISQTDGKISATAKDLTSSAVTRTATAKSDTKVAVSGTTVEAAIASLATSIKSVDDQAAVYEVHKLEASELSALGDSNVKEAYQLNKSKGGTTTQSGDVIKIYKDSALQSVELKDEKPATKTEAAKEGQFLAFTYLLADGSTQTEYLDCSKFLVESEFKNGLVVSTGGEVSVKIDTDSEYTTVSEFGIKISGIKSDLAAQKITIDTKSRTISSADGTSIAVPTAITTVSSDKFISGSVSSDTISLSLTVDPSVTSGAGSIPTTSAVYSFALTADTWNNGTEYDDLFA